MTVNILENFEKGILNQYTKNLTQLMPRKIVITISLMVLMSLNEAVSLLILVPLLGLVGLDVGQGSLGQIDGLVSGGFAYFGLQPSLVLVLVI
ncbi:MAG: hypothetical protein ABFC34_12715 [Methanobacterium sp.]